MEKPRIDLHATTRKRAYHPLEPGKWYADEPKPGRKTAFLFLRTSTYGAHDETVYAFSTIRYASPGTLDRYRGRLKRGEYWVAMLDIPSGLYQVTPEDVELIKRLENGRN